MDDILRDCVAHKLKPATNNHWIFAFGPLVVVFPLEARPELWAAFDKVGRPTCPDMWRVACREKSICHISHNRHPRRKSFGSEVKVVLNKD